MSKRNHESSTSRRPWPNRGFCTVVKKRINDFIVTAFLTESLICMRGNLLSKLVLSLSTKIYFRVTEVHECNSKHFETKRHYVTCFILRTYRYFASYPH